MMSLTETLGRLKTWGVMEGDVDATLDELCKADTSEIVIAHGELEQVIAQGVSCVQRGYRFLAVVPSGDGERVRSALVGAKCS